MQVMLCKWIKMGLATCVVSSGSGMHVSGIPAVKLPMIAGRSTQRSGSWNLTTELRIYVGNGYDPRASAGRSSRKSLRAHPVVVSDQASSLERCAALPGPGRDHGKIQMPDEIVFMVM